LMLRPYPGTDRRPQMLHRPTGDRSSLRAHRESQARLRTVEGEVAPLILDDALEHLDEHRVFRLRDQAMVPIERGELVQGAPRHVQRNEIAENGCRAERRDV